MIRRNKKPIDKTVVTTSNRNEFQACFLHNPHNGPSHCHAPTILETDSGDILVAWYAYGEDETRNAALLMACRDSGEQEWSHAKPILKDSRYSLGNPVLYQEANGTIWLLYVSLRGNFWNSALLQGIYSKDGGQSWSSSQLLWKERGMMIRHPPVIMSRGHCLLPAYDETTNQSVLLRKNAPNDHWRKVHTFEGPALIQPVLVSDKEESLSIFFRPTSAPNRIWRSFSLDEGKSWTHPIQTALPNPLSGIAAYSSDDSILLIYNPSKNKRYPLAISRSCNGGVTWDEARILDNANFEISYPSFIRGQDNQIHGVYSYNRRMIKYVSFPLTWYNEPSGS